MSRARYKIVKVGFRETDFKIMQEYVNRERLGPRGRSHRLAMIIMDAIEHEKRRTKARRALERLRREQNAAIP